MKKLIPIFFLLFSLTTISNTKEKPNFIVLLADDVSAASLGCYGSENKGTSPNIDKLASVGVMFTNMFVSEAICAPARAELYTGLQPVRNGCYRNHMTTKKGTKSVVHYLSDLGYRVGLSGKRHFSPKSVYPFEFIEGFPKDCNSRYESSEDWNDVEKFITRDKDQPFCLFLCSIHAHSPWDAGDSKPWDINEVVLPPHFVDTKETRHQFREYLAEVKLFDDQVGKTMEMMKRLKLDKNTVLIVLDENGAGMVGGKWTNYDWGVRSACVMKWPKQYNAKIKTNGIAQYCDILPTMIDAAGGRIPEYLDGKSLLKLIKGEEPEHREYAFFVYNNLPAGPSYPIRAVTDGKYKLVWNLQHQTLFGSRTINGFDFGHSDKMLDRPERFIYLSWLERAKTNEQAQIMVDRHRKRPEFELYNLNNDPWELNNLAQEEAYKPQMDKLKFAMEEWMNNQGDKGLELDLDSSPGKADH